MPKHTSEKAHLERTGRGSFWRDSCAPHSRLLAQTQTAGPEEGASEPRGQRSSLWLRCRPPACFCWAGLRHQGAKARPWGFRTPGDQERGTTAHLGLERPCGLPAVTSRGPEHLTCAHTCVPVLGGLHLPHALPFRPLPLLPHLLLLGACSLRLASGIISPEKLLYSPSSPDVYLGHGSTVTVGAQ